MGDELDSRITGGSASGAREPRDVTARGPGTGAAGC